VNKAARTIEKALKTGIDQRHPGHRYITVQRSLSDLARFISKSWTDGKGEDNLDDRPTWLLNPLDGTFLILMPRLIFC
jgi:hypothetical protein